MHGPFKILGLATGLLLSACTPPSAGPRSLVLDYDAFGPPVIARELLGRDGWQWLEIGEWLPRRYPVKVVVYRDMDIEVLTQAFPVDPERELDHRYVEYSAALRFLDEKIGEDLMPVLIEHLGQTRERIIRELGPG